MTFRACRRCLAYEGMTHYMNRRAIPERLLWAFSVGDDGVCSLCRAYEAAFDPSLLEMELVRLAGAAKRGVVVAFSGGKDSISTLFIARRRLRLDAVAFLFDNGFIPRPVIAQAERVCAELGARLVVGRPQKREQSRFLKLVETAGADDAPPCDTCSDLIARELGRVVDDVDAGAVLVGTNYWIAWDERLHAVSTRVTPSGRKVLFANLHYAARVTHAGVLKNVKAAGAEVLSMPGVSSNCTVPALVQKRLGSAIGHVAELEDLSLEVMVGHRTRKSALDELAKKAPEQADLVAALRGVTASSSRPSRPSRPSPAPAARSAASRARPSTRSPARARPSPPRR